MLPVQGPTVAPAAGSRRPAAATGRAGFLPTDSAAPASDAAATAQAEPVLAAAMLALQEEAGGSDAVRDRQARRRGSDLIEALSALQRGLLQGAVDPALLRRLSGLAADPAQAADPGLRHVVAAIRLRACVELARYGAG